MTQESEVDMGMLCIVSLACTTALAPSAGATNQAARRLTLSSLLPGRRIEVASSAADIYQAWLILGKYRVALIGRENLEEQVTIRTPQEALELVRVFTTADSWYLSRVEAMVELRSGARANPSDFVVPEAEFHKCCLPAVATVAPESTPKSMWFVVQRTVVERDYKVYVIKEIVGQNGRIVTTEKKLVDRDGRELGFFVALP